MKSFKTFGATDLDLNRLQGNVSDALDPLLRKEIIDGVLIQGVSIAVGTPTRVSHGLGRPVQGWFLTRQRANAVVWDTQDAELKVVAARTLTLNASADVTVDVWIF